MHETKDLTLTMSFVYTRRLLIFLVDKVVEAEGTEILRSYIEVYIYVDLSL